LLGAVEGIAGFTGAIVARFMSLPNELILERKLREKDLENWRRDLETEKARRERDVSAAKQETADRLRMLGFPEEYFKYQKKLGLQASVATDNPDE
jgi:hypothetical protein